MRESNQPLEILFLMNLARSQLTLHKRNNRVDVLLRGRRAEKDRSEDRSTPAGRAHCNTASGGRFAGTSDRLGTRSFEGAWESGRSTEAKDVAGRTCAASTGPAVNDQGGQTMDLTLFELGTSKERSSHKPTASTTAYPRQMEMPWAI
jgi:hypothetical protein